MLTKTNLMCDCNVIHENKVKESKKNMLKLRTIEDMSNFFKILGEPTRIKIVYKNPNMNDWVKEQLSFYLTLDR